MCTYFYDSKVVPSLSRDCHCEWVTAYDWAYLDVAHKLFKKSRLITPSIRLLTWLPRHLYHKRALEPEKRQALLLASATVQLLTRHWGTSRHWGIFFYDEDVTDERDSCRACRERSLQSLLSSLTARKEPQVESPTTVRRSKLLLSTSS